MFANGPPCIPIPAWAQAWEWVVWGVLTAAGIALGGYAVIRVPRRYGRWMLLALALLFIGWLVACVSWVRYQKHHIERQREQ